MEFPKAIYVWREELDLPWEFALVPPDGIYAAQYTLNDVGRVEIAVKLREVKD